MRAFLLDPYSSILAIRLLVNGSRSRFCNSLNYWRYCQNLSKDIYRSYLGNIVDKLKKQSNISAL